MNLINKKLDLVSFNKKGDKGHFNITERQSTISK
jgi:hypothetical protein